MVNVATTKIMIALLGIILIGGCINQSQTGGSDNGFLKNNQVSDNTPPLISRTSTSPSNPSLSDSFKISVTAEDENRLRKISWRASKPLTVGQSGSFECGIEKTCSNSWEFTALEEGQIQITVTAEDSSGQKSETILEVNVGPARKSTTSTTTTTSTTAYFTCANNVCEGGESYESCPQDCGISDIIGSACGNGACEPGEDSKNCAKDCTTIKPNCGNNVCDSGETASTCSADCKETAVSCSSDSSCGYKQKCIGSVCQSVACTNNAHCSGCRRCSNNECVSCGSGPYGCYC